MVQAESRAGSPLAVPQATSVAVSGAGGLVPHSLVLAAGRSVAAASIGRLSPSVRRLVTATAPGFGSTTLVLPPVGSGFGATASGAPQATLRMGPLRVPVAWLFPAFLAAAAALACFLVVTGRRQRRVHDRRQHG